jgi:hypothetical protein
MWHHIAENCDLNTHHYNNLKSHMTGITKGFVNFQILKDIEVDFLIELGKNITYLRSTISLLCGQNSSFLCHGWHTYQFKCPFLHLFMIEVVC